MMTNTCKNCLVPIGAGYFCIDCFRAWTYGALHMLGGLMVSGAVGWIVRWLLS